MSITDLFARNRCRKTWTAAAVQVAAVMVGLTALEAQSLRVSTSSMNLQHREAERHGYSFIRTPSELREFVELGYLVEVQGDENFRLKEVSFPYTRPAVKDFIELLGQKYRQACGEELVVTSLTRPRTRQPRNASRRSVHQAGMAIDIRRSWSRGCRKWMEETLLTLESNGVVDAMLERSPPHFHVAVFPQQYRAYGKEVLRSGERTHYRVARGDTLWKIAHRHRTEVQAVKEANGLRSNRIYEGQVLKLPSPVSP